MAYRLVPLLFLAQAGVVHAQTALPAYHLLRADEDWGVLRDATLRTAPWLRLKYIPLREGWYLSLGADVRERYEGYADEGFGTGTADGNGYLQHRLTGHIDLHMGPWRVFGQLNTALQHFRPEPARANDVDRLDVHQAFVERGIQAGSLKFSLRAGRQEIRLGSTRLSGVREGPNVRLTFDGVRVTLGRPEAWRVDLVAAHPVETRRRVFDNRPVSSQTFWGSYGSKRLPGKRGSLDVYYLAVARRRARFAQGTADEVRHSFGVRLWRAPSTGTIDHDWEFVRQTGRFGSGQLRAWYAASETGYTVRRQLRLALKANAASGDSDPAAAQLGTFHALYPDTKDFREQVGPGPLNSIVVRPFVEAGVPVGGVTATVTAGLDLFWRTSVRDGLYSFGGNPLIARPSSGARYIGTKPAVVVQAPLNRFTSVNFIYSYLAPGRLVKEALPGKTPSYLAILLAYRF